jgi:hypothetical protein
MIFLSGNLFVHVATWVADKMTHYVSVRGSNVKTLVIVGIGAVLFGTIRGLSVKRIPHIHDYFFSCTKHVSANVYG